MTCDDVLELEPFEVVGWNCPSGTVPIGTGNRPVCINLQNDLQFGNNTGQRGGNSSGGGQGIAGGGGADSGGDDPPRKKDPCAKLSRALEDAKLAGASYEGRSPPTGWSENTDLSRDYASGLNVRAFDGPNGELAVSYRGTTGSLLGADWTTNGIQGIGLVGAQYIQATSYFGYLSITGHSPTRVVGHSLGGGLASIVGTGYGVPTSTFNAAGVHGSALDSAHITRSIAMEHVNACYVPGEVLSYYQDGLGVAPDALGNRIPLSHPFAVANYGIATVLKGVQTSVDLHSIDSMIEAIEAAMSEAGCN